MDIFFKARKSVKTLPLIDLDFELLYCLGIPMGLYLRPVNVKQSQNKS